MFEFLIKKLKAHPRKIVFTEGTDPRILEASARLLSGTFLTPVLVGNPDEIQAAAEECGFNVRGAVIADPANYEKMDEMVEKMVHASCSPPFTSNVKMLPPPLGKSLV